jgi:hypothetical protein
MGGRRGVTTKHKNLTLPVEMGKQIFTTTPSKMHRNAPFLYLKYRKKFSGEGTPPPAPHTPRRLDSRDFGARWDPQENPGYGPGREGKGEVGQGTGDEGGKEGPPQPLA